MHRNPGPFVRILLIAAGTACVGVGVVGVFVPVLPTTPFLLLAAAAYLRGSMRFYNWLINHRILGRYISYYREGHGMPVGATVITLALLWATIITSAIFFVSAPAMQVGLVVIACGVTAFILTKAVGPKRSPGPSATPPEAQSPGIEPPDRSPGDDPSTPRPPRDGPPQDPPLH